VLAVAVAAFMAYDLITFRETQKRSLVTLAQVAAENSSAAVAFANEKDATDVLNSHSRTMQTGTGPRRMRLSVS